jgi:c(7)-type cytochrome triheme protein
MGIWAALGGGAALSGCDKETQYRVLSTLFENVPRPDEPGKPRPVVRRSRRPPPEKPSVPVVAEAPMPAPEPEKPPAVREWRDALRLLPKDAAGGVDWVKAIADKAIEPRPGLGPEAKDQPTFPIEIELTAADNPTFKATFPHLPHTQVLACTNCHPAVFQMRRGTAQIKMTNIYAGEFCGRCHGKVAFAPATGCPRCHRAMAPPKQAAPGPAPPGPPKQPAAEKLKTWEEVTKALPAAATGGVDWVKALAEGLVAPRGGIEPKATGQPPFDLTIEREPPGQPLFKVVFSHGVHTQWLACANCHPTIFQMKKGATPINMGLLYAGQACGSCHGKVAFAVPTGCARCHPAMAPK